MHRYSVLPIIDKNLWNIKECGMNLLQKGVVCVVAIGALSSLFGTEFEIMPTVGKKIADDDKTLDDSKVLMGIRGTAYVTPNIGIQAVGESSLNNPTIGGGDTDIERASLNAIYEKRSGRVRPYVMAGAGYEWTHGNTVKLTDDDSQAFANAGAGVKFDLKKNLSLVTEVKGMHKFENGDNDLIGTVGLGMRVGAPEEKKPTCSAKKVLTLDEFSKMCKAQKSAPSIEPMPVTQMQHEPQVVVEERVPVVEESPKKATEEIPVARTCEIEGPIVTENEAKKGAGTPIPEGYYVQMAALFKSNGAILTGKLERKKYPYVTYNTKRGGKDVTLVLVGPYHSRKEASIARRYLKRLSRGAFVKKFP